MRLGKTSGAMRALVAAGVATALLFGCVTAAGASPISRAQAVRKAREYLQYQSFSLKGLVTQLKFEGFSTSDSRYGASHAGANWWKEAVAKAKEYLKTEAFSHSGLVTQLEFEGFTPAQAEYGVRGAGL